jgi:hypothetical protein
MNAEFQVGTRSVLGRLDNWVHQAILPGHSRRLAGRVLRGRIEKLISQRILQPHVRARAMPWLTSGALCPVVESD